MKLFPNLGFLPEWPAWIPPQRWVCCTLGPEWSWFLISPEFFSQHPASRPSIRLPRLKQYSDHRTKKEPKWTTACARSCLIFTLHPQLFSRQHMCQLSCVFYFDRNAKQKDETAVMPDVFCSHLFQDPAWLCASGPCVHPRFHCTTCIVGTNRRTDWLIDWWLMQFPFFTHKFNFGPKTGILCYVILHSGISLPGKQLQNCSHNQCCGQPSVVTFWHQRMFNDASAQRLYSYLAQCRLEACIARTTKSLLGSH